jgi:hypothetical protein
MSNKKSNGASYNSSAADYPTSTFSESEYDGLLLKWLFLREAMHDQVLEQSSKIVLSELLERHNITTNKCFGSTRKLAKLLGMARQTVITAIQQLVAEGWICVVQFGRHLSNDFTFNWDKRATTTAKPGRKLTPEHAAKVQTGYRKWNEKQKKVVYPLDQGGLTIRPEMDQPLDQGGLTIKAPIDEDNRRCTIDEAIDKTAAHKPSQANNQGTVDRGQGPTNKQPTGSNLHDNGSMPFHPRYSEAHAAADQPGSANAVLPHDKDGSPPIQSDLGQPTNDTDGPGDSLPHVPGKPTVLAQEVSPPAPSKPVRPSKKKKSADVFKSVAADAVAREKQISDAAFAVFWDKYPQREAHGNKHIEKATRKVWDQKIKRGVNPDTILAGLASFCAAMQTTEQQYITRVRKWLEQEMWANYYADPSLEKVRTSKNPMFEAAREANRRNAVAALLNGGGADEPKPKLLNGAGVSS